MTLQTFREMLRRRWLGRETILALLLCIPAYSAPGRSGRRVDDNSLARLAPNILLADVDGDGRADLITIERDTAGLHVTARRHDPPFEPIASFDSQDYATPVRWWAGRFDTGDRDSICFRSPDQEGSADDWYSQSVTCLLMQTPASKSLAVSSHTHAPPQWLEVQELSVGDLDGDGHDELITYSSADNLNISFFAYSADGFMATSSFESQSFSKPAASPRAAIPIPGPQNPVNVPLIPSTDLAVSAPMLQVSCTRLQLTVTDRGPLDAAPFDIVATVTPIDSFSPIEFARATVSGLMASGPSSSRTMALNRPVPLDAGCYNAYVVVDPDSRVDVFTRANNHVYPPVLLRCNVPNCNGAPPPF